MDECSTTDTFPNLHPPQPFHIVPPHHHSSMPGYSSSHPPLPLPSPDEQTIPYFTTFDTDQREVLHEEHSLLSANSLEEDLNMGDHFKGEDKLWCTQEDDSPSDDFYAKASYYKVHGGNTGCNTSHLPHMSKASVGFIPKHDTNFRESAQSSGSIGLDLSIPNWGACDLDRKNYGLNEEVNISPWTTAKDLWRGDSSNPTALKTFGLNGRAFTQKLDSFSDAFLSQTKKRLPVITSTDGQPWDSVIRPRLSCSMDSDSSSPSLMSFPSPSSSNLLSPPPTPLPPTSQSPYKLDSPGGGGLSVQGGEAGGALQFFPVRASSLLAPNSPGTFWRFPTGSHCFTELAGEAGGSNGMARVSTTSSLSYNTSPNNCVQSPVPSFPLVSVLQSPRAVFSSIHSVHHFPTAQSNHQNQDNRKPSHQQDPECPVYTRTTFPSMLQSDRGHFTPPPQLNPSRRGPGLYSSTGHTHPDSGPGERSLDSPKALPCINVGPEFQADIPPCLLDEWSYDKEASPQEDLLWKPWDELTHSTAVQDQVEKLLQMCSSSCLPGGGLNTELALHCLHHCHGDVMATLEMLLFSQLVPAEDYHYSGADVWTEREKRLFTAALETHRKDFSLIQTMVKTKTVAQCVELYYVRKKLDKEKTFNMEEESKVEDMEKPTITTPTQQPIAQQVRQEEVAPVPLLAGSFPCKLCGKMFYKIKSRNAHMKIHRQTQEDWTDKKSPQKCFNPALNHGFLVRPQIFTENNIICGNSINLMNTNMPEQMNILALNSSALHVNPGANSTGQMPQEPMSVFQFQPMWSSFGQNSSFLYNTEAKIEGVAAAVKWE